MSTATCSPPTTTAETEHPAPTIVAVDGLWRSAYEVALGDARRDALLRRDAAHTIYCPACNESVAKATDTAPGLLWQQQDQRAGSDLLAQVIAQHDADTANFIVGDLKRWQRRARRDIERIVDWFGEPDDDWQDGTPLLVRHCGEQWAIDIPKLVARCRTPAEAGVRSSRLRRVSVADIAARWNP